MRAVHEKKTERVSPSPSIIYLPNFYPPSDKRELMGGVNSYHRSQDPPSILDVDKTRELPDKRAQLFEGTVHAYSKANQCKCAYKVCATVYAGNFC